MASFFFFFSCTRSRLDVPLTPPLQLARRIGQRVADRAVRLQKELARHLPSENKNQIYNLHNLCGVEIKGREDQCGSTLPRVSS